MAYPLTPKLKIPLALEGGALATVEQGTVDEVAQCVYAIVATPLGSRIDDLDFGIEEPAFEELPLDVTEMLAQVNTYEPDAQVSVAQEIEELAGRVVVEVAS